MQSEHGLTCQVWLIPNLLIALPDAHISECLHQTASQVCPCVIPAAVLHAMYQLQHQNVLLLCSGSYAPAIQLQAQLADCLIEACISSRQLKCCTKPPVCHLRLSGVPGSWHHLELHKPAFALML